MDLTFLVFTLAFGAILTWAAVFFMPAGRTRAMLSQLSLRLGYGLTLGGLLGSLYGAAASPESPSKGQLEFIVAHTLIGTLIGAIAAPALPVPRITTRRLMIAVAIVALLLWPVHCIRQWPHYARQAQYYGMMSDLCVAESKLMQERSAACLARARRGVPWDESRLEAEDLKCCPYINDVPRHNDWSELAAIWDRAAQRADRAAGWYARMRMYYEGIDPRAPERLR